MEIDNRRRDEDECVIPHVSTLKLAKGDVGEALLRGVVNGARMLMHTDVVRNTVGIKLLAVDLPEQPRMRDS